MFGKVGSTGLLINKFLSAGQKLWETTITGTPEIDAIEYGFYETMNKILGLADAISPLRKYSSGVSSYEGHLYLATYSYPGSSLWIHQFTGSGELISRFKLDSEVELYSIFDMDFDERRIFVVTAETEIRAYYF